MKSSLHHWYRVWTSLLPLFFPLYLVRFEVGPVPTTLLEGVILVTILVGGLLFIRPRKILPWLAEQIFYTKWTRNPVWPALGVLVAATISMVIVPETVKDITDEILPTARQAQGIWKGWILVPILYFFLIRGLSKDAGWWPRSRVALALSGAGLSVWAIFQMATGAGLALDGRALGPFDSANSLALYLGPVVVLALVQAFQATVGRAHAGVGFWAGVSALMGIALWGTQSYAAFLSVAGGLIFYFLFTASVSWRTKRWGMVLGICVGAVLFLSQMDTPKFQQFLDFSDRSSSSVRIEVYTIAGTLIRENPVLGIGLGQFGTEYRLNAVRILEHFPYEWVMIHPHNFLLATWLNLGLLGLVSMVWLVGLVFWNRFSTGARSWKKRFVSWWRSVRSLGRSVVAQHATVHARELAAAMLVVILLHGLFDTPFFKNDLAYLWWWVVVMGV